MHRLYARHLGGAAHWGGEEDQSCRWERLTGTAGAPGSTLLVRAKEEGRPLVVGEARS